MPPEENELVRLINTRIEKLRPKLLDLTRRNPLLSTKFSDRSHSHIRVVDELPQVLFEMMTSGSMKFDLLPPLEEDPKDEKTMEFQRALSSARLIDEVYLNKLENIDQDSEDSANQLAVAERELRDRLREELGLYPRQTKTNITLVHHARNNHIRPGYELPLSSETHSDGRHEDDLIQTLLLPDLFERRLNSLISKCNTWRQETGINVLKAAYGFLEWKESPTSDPSLAPLILLPVEIEKKKTRSGFEYSVSGQDEDPETNTVLVEKISNNEALKKIEMFFKHKEEILSIYNRFKSIYSDPLDVSLPKKLESLSKIVSEMELPNLDINSVKRICGKNNSGLLMIQEEIKIVSAAGKVKAFFLNKNIQTVVTACDIGARSQRSILAMRRKTFEPALMKVVIAKSSKKCDSLKKKRGELEKDYYLESLDMNEIQRNYEIFVNSGFFAMFSSKYSIAKRSYLSMSKDKKFKKAKAIEQSKVILKWLEEVKSFNESNELLEDCFDGLETDYRPIEELMDYYDQIDTKLRGVENEELREFLKRGEADSILALPKKEADHTIRKCNCPSFKELSEKADQVKANIEKFKGYIGELERAMTVFIDYKYVDVNLLPKAGNELHAFQEGYESLSKYADLSSLLGNHFDGIETDSKNIKTSINAASRVSNLSDELGNTMIAALKDGSIDERIVDLDAIINNDLKIKEEISQLAQLLNVKSEEITLSKTKDELSIFLDEASNNKEGLIAFSIVYANRLNLHSRGLRSIIDKLMLSEGKIAGLSDIVLAVIGQSLAKEVYKEYGNVLASYNGIKLNSLRQKLAALDKEIIRLSRERLRIQLMKNSSPPNGIGRGEKSKWTNMSLLRN
ncbi:MAG: DUF4011 domain-containing protein [Candidatus Scalindua sp.]